MDQQSYTTTNSTNGAFNQVSPFNFSGQYPGTNNAGGFLPLAWTSHFLQSNNHSHFNSNSFNSSFSDVLDTLSQMAQAGASEKTLESATKNMQLETEVNADDLFEITGMHLPTLQSLLFNQNQTAKETKDEKNAVEVGLSDVFRWDQNWIANINPQLAQQLPQQMQPMSIALQSPQSLNPEFIQQLQKAYQKHQPVRVSINNDISVIFKFAQDGTMSAAFLASTPQVSLLLKEQLSQLQQQLESKSLPFVELTVKDQQQQKKQQQKQQQS